MEDEQPAAAPIVGEELPGEAELQLEVAQEPVALEPAVAAPSPARGAVIMSRGLRTRDGDSLLVRFVNHEGWLEARALDCSGGKVGRVVLCGIADDDAAAVRRTCCFCRRVFLQQQGGAVAPLPMPIPSARSTLSHTSACVGSTAPWPLPPGWVEGVPCRPGPTWHWSELGRRPGRIRLSNSRLSLGCASSGASASRAPRTPRPRL